MPEDTVSKLNPHRSETNYVRIIQTDADGMHKLFGVQFNIDRSGRLQLFIHPYLNSTRGLITKCVQRPNQDTLSLEPNGKITSRLPKYSHGQDGMAHFSGNIFSIIKNQSRRLDDLDTGQLFSITIHDYAAFVELSEDTDTSTNQYIKLETNPIDNQKTMRIAGWWYSSANVRINVPEIGPTFVYTLNDKPRQAIMIAPDFGDDTHPLSQHFLLLDFTFEDTPADPANYTLMAGFDPERSPDKKFKFLVQTYPVANYEDQVERLGSIDYYPGQEPPIPTEYEQD